MIDHLLEGARTIRQALIVRQVNHPHPAAADQTLDRIASLKYGAGFERTRQRS